MSGGEWKPGKIGGALQFDGKDDHVSLPAMPIAGRLTLAFWVKLEDPGKHIVFTDNKRGGWNAGQGWFMEYKQGATLTVAGSSGRALWTRYKFDKGWHHVAATIDGTTATAYVDGAQIGQGQVDPLVASDAPVSVGRSVAHRSLSVHGAMDDFRIYDRVLSANDVRSVYELGKTAGPPPEVTEGLVAWYKFDDGEGKRAEDSSGNNHHGDLKNMSGEEWAPGKVGGALQF
ncbi:MAG: LamG domain-containing protein, partial [Planctomycetota bacterium]